MARTQVSMNYTCSFEQAEAIVNSILSSNGFHTTTLKSGENVWKKGTGLMTAMEFIKVDFAAGSAQVYGWVQAGVGSVGGREMDLNGFVAIVPKKSVKKVMDQLQAALAQQA